MAIKISHEKITVIRKTLRMLCRICVAAVAYVVWQALLFASFRIPTDSMQPGLTGGDYALVWKLILEARVFHLFDAVKGEKVPVHRLPGLRKVRHNDVPVFHFSYPHRGDSIGMHMLKLDV